MVTDFQAAWTELQARIASGGPDGKKTSWGQSDLLKEMGMIAGEHRVPEDLLEAAARLTGWPLQTQIAETSPPSAEDSASSGAMERDHRPPNDRGGHDGPRDTAGNGDRRESPA